MKRALVLVAALLTLAACSDPPVEGRVTHKQHSDAYDYVTMICAGYSTQGACTVWVPIFNHMPASWQLCIDGVDKNNKKASGCIEVPQETYSRYSEGSDYPKGGNQ